MLWEDHRNDLFINGFGECLARQREWAGKWTHEGGGTTGLLMSAGGSKLRWCECPFMLVRGSVLGLYLHPRRLGPDGSHHRAFSRSRQPAWGPKRHLFTLPSQIAAGVIIAWSRTIYRQFELLAGKSAPHDFIQLLIYKTMTFSNGIEKVDTVRAYHVGFFSAHRCGSRQVADVYTSRARTFVRVDRTISSK